MIKALNGVARIAQEMANGNLSIKAHERSAQDALMQALNMMIKRMQEVVSNTVGGKRDCYRTKSVIDTHDDEFERY